MTLTAAAVFLMLSMPATMPAPLPGLPPVGYFPWQCLADLDDCLASCVNRPPMCEMVCEAQYEACTSSWPH